MPLPTTATGPTNVYVIMDDTAATVPGANATAAAVGGGASGAQIVTEFLALTGANAIQIAHIIASALQRPLRVANKYTGAPPWTLVQGAPANTAITSVPSGVGY